MVMTSSITSRKIAIFRDTGDYQEHDAKNCLLIPPTSSEKTREEIVSVKEN